MKVRAFLLLACCVFTSSLLAARPPVAAIASAHPLATQAGMEVLASGGNAFDAAVAVSAALAVVEPYGSGLGGGGFWLLHRERDGFEVMVDGREKAPLGASHNMYLDKDGKVVAGLSVNGALAAAIPGVPAALAHISHHYGRLPLHRSLAPAIRLAREGFEVDAIYRKMAQFRLTALQDDLAAAEIFLQNDEVPAMGYRVVQPDLADSLTAIARSGHDGFYRGEVAHKLVAGVRAAGGIWSMQDLAQYRIVERQPVRGEYHGMRISSAAPPSSGGIALVSMLNILAAYPLQQLDEVTRTHLVIEAMRRAYRDRAEFLGDSDFVDVPVEYLSSRAHARQMAESIRLGQATPSTMFPVSVMPAEGQNTTHFSILDAAGNRVAATLSINYPFGACVVSPGTGILLNDEMDDFSAKPGAPNVYGLVGTAANAIAPGKRPLSSMTPTFVENAGGVAILGTPGGSRIITMVLLAVLDMAAGGDPQSWVSLPRYHHQYLPDVVQFEPGAFDAEVQQGLLARGHELQPLDTSYGNMQAIYWNKQSGEVIPASDPRGIGDARIGLFGLK
ncbi:MAG: gamma-glutamyltransferase [Gammaproteobacteria bacterium]|jgi:gamma-glutamyltranspeptidase/glutathione hydrolase|nr:gamma-glutamyltransferase [Gammaproteobacteria bacterium]